ncbi:MAG: apolipoprotein N-acyltransferase [Phycisphaeraceae bacterium]
MRQALTHSPATPRAGFASMAMHMALLGLSALLLALAFPRPGWGWLAHVALVPAVILALRSTDSRRLFWASYLVGAVWWLLMVRWLMVVTVGGYIGLSLFYGLYWAVGLMLIRGLDRRYGRFPMTLAVPMVWVSLEMIRGHAPWGGFGWFVLGQTQAPFDVTTRAPWLIQCADLFGELTVSFVVAASSGLVVDLLTRSWWTRSRGGRSRFSYTLRWSITLWLLMVGGAAWYGGWRAGQAQTNEAAAAPLSLRIAVVQTNVPQDNKNSPRLETDQAMWDQLESLTHAAAALWPAPDLIVWPETMVPAPINSEAQRDFAADALYWQSVTAQDLQAREDAQHVAAVAQQLGVTLEQLPDHLARWMSWRASMRDRVSELARQVGTPLLIGSGTYLPAPNDGPAQSYNSVYLFDANGVPRRQHYDKIHRVPFGEYLPGIDSWPWLKDLFLRYLSPYESDYSLTPGDRSFAVFELPLSLASAPPAPDGGKARLATPICFEDAIPRATRWMVYAADGEKRTDVLVNLTNDGWYTGWDQQPQHVQLAVLRCVELRVPMARSVNSGISGFIDAHGRVGPLVIVDGQAHSVSGVVAAEVVVDPRRTLFGRCGEAPMWALVIVTGSCVLVGVIMPRRRTQSLVESSG